MYVLIFPVEEPADRTDLL